MKESKINLQDPDSLMELLPTTQPELQELINRGSQYMENLPRSAQVQTTQTELHQYRQHIEKHAVRQNLESTVGLTLILVGMLIHTKLAYAKEKSVLPKNLEESQYTLGGFVKLWNLHDNDL
jgi:hypothetical protein